jgi:ribonuclease P protein component
LPHSRLGITTPVRVGNAVQRNRLRRRVREVFRLNRANLPGGWDILVNPREALGKVSFATLQRELLRLFPQQPPSSPAHVGS